MVVMSRSMMGGRRAELPAKSLSNVTPNKAPPPPASTPLEETETALMVALLAFDPADDE